MHLGAKSEVIPNFIVQTTKATHNNVSQNWQNCDNSSEDPLLQGIFKLDVDSNQMGFLHIDGQQFRAFLGLLKRKFRPLNWPQKSVSHNACHGMTHWHYNCLIDIDILTENSYTFLNQITWTIRRNSNPNKDDSEYNQFIVKRYLYMLTQLLTTCATGGY